MHHHQVNCFHFLYIDPDIVLPVSWIAECHTCGKVGPYRDSSRGRQIQHNGRDRKYCGYYSLNPRIDNSIASSCGAVRSCRFEKRSRVNFDIEEISPVDKRRTGPSLSVTLPSNEKTLANHSGHDQDVHREAQQQQRIPDRRHHEAITSIWSVFSRAQVDSPDHHSATDCVSCDTAGSGKFNRLKRKYSGRVGLLLNASSVSSQSGVSAFDYDSE